MVASTPALLVPPVRLGRLLGDARTGRGETLSDLARRCGLAFEEDFFVDVEAGRAVLDEPLVGWLTELYGVESGRLVPARAQLVIDLTEGQVSVGETHVAFEQRDPDHILTNYLALVYSLRGLPVGTPIPLRHNDVAVLSEALGSTPGQISCSLGSMMATDSDQVRARARGFRRRLIVPVAGVLVGLTAMGGLLLMPNDGAGSAGPVGGGPGPSARAEAVVPVEIGDAVVLERASLGDTTAVQTIRKG